MVGRSEVLFEEDLVAIEQAVIKYPICGDELAEIAELSGRLKLLGFEIIPKLKMMLKEHGTSLQRFPLPWQCSSASSFHLNL